MVTHVKFSVFFSVFTKGLKMTTTCREMMDGKTVRGKGERMCYKQCTSCDGDKRATTVEL